MSADNIMIIGGIQKLTLLDYPGKVACTFFTVGCNMRCPFCHNASLVARAKDADICDSRDIMDLLKKRQGILDGVVISGGEPTLMGGLYEFICSVKELGYDVKLDTNGTSPSILSRLIDDGMLDYVAMDIKNSPDMYDITCGLNGKSVLGDVSKSIEILMENKVDFEFRTTLVSPYHTQDSIKRMGQWIAGDEKLYLQHFVDSGDLVGNGVSAIDFEYASRLLDAVRLYVKNAQLRGF